MENNLELIRIVEATVFFAGLSAIFLAVVRQKTTQSTIASQKELIDTLTVQVNELRQLHIDNEKAISELSGQIKVYKEIPLKQIADSLTNLDHMQKEILKKVKE